MHRSLTRPNDDAEARLLAHRLAWYVRGGVPPVMPELLVEFYDQDGVAHDGRPMTEPEILDLLTSDSDVGRLVRWARNVMTPAEVADDLVRRKAVRRAGDLLDVVDEGRPDALAGYRRRYREYEEWRAGL